MTANDYIETLALQAHVEGGAFSEVYRSPLELNLENTPYPSGRAASTAIYFLLKQGQFSAFHRILSDELWHFYDGDPLHVYEIKPSGEMIDHVLGRNLNGGEQLMTVIPGGSWFASRCETPGGYSLCGCTVAPGFDFEDFELAERNTLTEDFPKYKNLIHELTYEK